MFAGIALRAERQHNDNAWLAWHIAFMTAYAPQKTKSFWKLKALLWRKPEVAGSPSKPSWKNSYAAFSAWAQSKTKKS